MGCLRKKPLNYRAQQVTKSLFETDTSISATLENPKMLKAPLHGNKKQKSKKPEASISRVKEIRKCDGKTNDPQGEHEKPVTLKSSVLRPKKAKTCESWFCFLCGEDVVKDMSLCNGCQRYVHEECVGLTKDDKNEKFVCPDCENA